MLKAFTIVIFSLVLLTNVAQAEQLDNDIAIKCVQRNLELLGYDPRGVDGRIGPGTSKAAAAFQKDFTTQKLESLTTANASGWCSEMLKNFSDKLFFC